MLGETITQASNLNTNTKLYSFHDRTIHIRGGIYRGPSLRNLYTNDHYTPLSNQYNPFELQGRSCLFTLGNYILHAILFDHQSCFDHGCLRNLQLESSLVESFWPHVLSEVKSLSSLLMYFTFSACFERSRTFFFALESYKQTLTWNFGNQLRSYVAMFLGEVKSRT